MAQRGHRGFRDPLVCLGREGAKDYRGHRAYRVCRALLVHKAPKDDWGHKEPLGQSAFKDQRENREPKEVFRLEVSFSGWGRLCPLGGS